MQAFLFPDPLRPCRPPAWRFQTALASVQSSRFEPCTDNGVLAAKRFWRQWNACRSDHDRRLVALRMPNMFGAFTLFQDGPQLSRAAVEARILANEPRDSIAKKTGLAPKILQTFEDLFYDVRGDLDHADYIFNEVIGPDLRKPHRRVRVDLIWKFFGYVGGVAILDAFMDTCRSGAGKPATEKDIERFLAADSAATLRQKIAIATRFVDADSSRTAKVLMAALTAAVVKEEALQPTNLEQHVAAFLEGIPWLVGDEKSDAGGVQRLQKFDEAAAELRDDEILHVARGEDSTRLEKEVLGLTMPPPSKVALRPETKPPLPLRPLAGAPRRRANFDDLREEG